MAQDEEDQPLTRPQRRLVRRLYNGRTIPIIADDRPFLTYKDAVRYLHALPVGVRDGVIDQMKVHADAIGR